MTSDLYLSGKEPKAAKDAKAGAPAGKDGKKSKEAEDDSLAGKEPKKTKINVVLVADIDWILNPQIFQIREAGSDPDDPNQVDFKFQNIPFALNIIDSLAKDDRFIELRKRTRSHRTLTKVEEATEDQRKEALDDQTKFYNDVASRLKLRSKTITRRLPIWRTAKT